MTGHQLVSPALLSHPSSYLPAFRTALPKPTNDRGSICNRPRPLALKEPPHRQWRLSPVTDFLSPSAPSPLPCSFLCSLHLLCPSSPHPNYLASLPNFLFSSLFLSPALLSLSTPSPVRCTCAGWSLSGRSRKCFCAEQRGRGDHSRHLTNIS